MSEKYLRVTMEDGSKWDVPVRVIAENRAAEYRGEFGDSIERSLNEDTLPLFECDDYEVEDWAANNMNWDDIKDLAVKIEDGNIDYQEGWVNGEKEVISK